MDPTRRPTPPRRCASPTKRPARGSARWGRVVPHRPEGRDAEPAPAEAVRIAYEAACARLVELAADCARPADGSDPRPMVAAPRGGVPKATAGTDRTSEA